MTPGQIHELIDQAEGSVVDLYVDLVGCYRVNTPEGVDARRRAVRAAIEAKDYDRAEALLFDYLAEGAIGKELIAELKKMYWEIQKLRVV